MIDQLELEKEQTQDVEFYEAKNIRYFIVPNKKYLVFKTQIGAYTFYNIGVQKYANNEPTIYYKRVAFFKDGKAYTDIKDRTMIIPKKIAEGVYYNEKKDPNHYNPIWTVYINEWEELETDYRREGDAIDEYKQETKNFNSKEFDEQMKTPVKSSIKTDDLDLELPF